MVQSMSRVGHCIDNGPIEGFWGIIKSEMYQMYEISDEASLRYAIKDYIRFYCQERPQSRYDCKTPLEVRNVALSSEHPLSYPIAKNNKMKSTSLSGLHKKTAVHLFCTTDLQKQTLFRYLTCLLDRGHIKLLSALKR